MSLASVVTNQIREVGIAVKGSVRKPIFADFASAVELRGGTNFWNDIRDSVIGMHNMLPDAKFAVMHRSNYRINLQSVTIVPVTNIDSLDGVRLLNHGITQDGRFKGIVTFGDNMLWSTYV